MKRSHLVLFMVLVISFLLLTGVDCPWGGGPIELPPPDPPEEPVTTPCDQDTLEAQTRACESCLDIKCKDMDHSKGAYKEGESLGWDADTIPFNYEEPLYCTSRCKSDILELPAEWFEVHPIPYVDCYEGCCGKYITPEGEEKQFQSSPFYFKEQNCRHAGDCGHPDVLKYKMGVAGTFDYYCRTQGFQTPGNMCEKERVCEASRGSDPPGSDNILNCKWHNPNYEWVC